MPTTQTRTSKTMAMTMHAPRPTRTALRQRIAKQDTSKTLTRDEVLDRALLRAHRLEAGTTR